MKTKIDYAEIISITDTQQNQFMPSELQKLFNTEIAKVKDVMIVDIQNVSHTIPINDISLITNKNKTYYIITYGLTGAVVDLCILIGIRESFRDFSPFGKK